MHGSTDEAPTLGIAIIDGPDGAEFSPSVVNAAAGTVLVWANETDEPQEFVVGRRRLSLTAKGTESSGAMTRIGEAGTWTVELATRPSAHLTIHASPAHDNVD